MSDAPAEVGSGDARIFYRSARKVRDGRLCSALTLGTALMCFTGWAAIKGIGQQGLRGLEVILPSAFAPLFAIVTLKGARRLWRGGVDELQISSEGVRCAHGFYAWSAIAYLGPSGPCPNDAVSLTIRRTPLKSEQRVRAFLVLDSRQPLTTAQYSRLISELRPFLAANYPSVQLGC
jgi:hypothetical protein